MADPVSITSFAGSLFGNMDIMSILKIGGIVLGTCIIILVGVWFVWNKIQWNLKVEFKLTRSGGQFIDSEWGKGSFNSAKGIVWIKRPKQKKIPMKPFDIKEYLQGGNILTVMQIGVREFLPVHPDSFKKVIDEYVGEDGKVHEAEVAVMSIRGETTEDKAWASTFEREAQSAYSITNFLKEHGGLLAMGLVLFMNLIGFAVLYSKIKP